MNKIIPLQEMIEEIKKHYNLNDTLLALNLKVTPQTVKGWKDGNIPREKTYNKILEIYNNIINSEEQTEEVTEVTEKKPYKISYPEGYPKERKLMWYIDNHGTFSGYDYYATSVDKIFYKTGLLFDTKEEAEQFLKEQTLIKKIKCYAKEQQGDWEPDWRDLNQRKYYIEIDRSNKNIVCDWSWEYDKLSKLPCFKSQEILKACIDEFGEEILEVFC